MSPLDKASGSGRVRSVPLVPDLVLVDELGRRVHHETLRRRHHEARQRAGLPSMPIRPLSKPRGSGQEPRFPRQRSSSAGVTVA